MDFTKASLSCQQYRGKRGAEGEPVEREHTILFPSDRLSQLREKPLCSGSRLLCGWHVCVTGGTHVLSVAHGRERRGKASKQWVLLLLVGSRQGVSIL